MNIADLNKELDSYVGEPLNTIRHYSVGYKGSNITVPTFVWITQVEYDWALAKLPDLARKGILVNVAKKLY